jgi:hypothetical protein
VRCLAHDRHGHGRGMCSPAGETLVTVAAAFVQQPARSGAFDPQDEIKGDRRP